MCEGINAEYGFIWDSLQMGFNDIYYTEEGFSKESKNLDINKYLQEINENAKQYAIRLNLKENGNN